MKFGQIAYVFPCFSLYIHHPLNLKFEKNIPHEIFCFEHVVQELKHELQKDMLERSTTEA